jgi:hypothetical protein
MLERLQRKLRRPCGRAPNYAIKRVWGMVTAMAKVIKYYVPDRFKKPAKWIPSNQRGKLIEFPLPEKKSA